MEENILKKKETEVPSNNNSSKSSVIAILIVIIIALIGAGVYFAFIKKNDQTINNGSNNQQEQSNTNLKVSKIELTEENVEQYVILNDTRVTLKYVEVGYDRFLYINDVKTDIEAVEWTEIYSTGNLLLLGGHDICGTIINYAVNENGTFIKVTKNYSEAYGDDGGEYYLNGDSIRVENGKIVADIGYYADCRCDAPDDYCEKNYHGKEKVEFVYDGKTLTINKMNNNQNTNNVKKRETIIIGDEVKKITLDQINQTVRINNKDIKLSVSNDVLYINDVKQNDIMLEGIVYATKKYILITNVGRVGAAIDYAVDENGKIINVYKSIVSQNNPYHEYQVNDIKYENGKVVAKYIDECFDEKNCVEKEKKIEFVYDGNNIIMKDISLDKDTKSLTKIELKDTNTIISFNGKQVKLKATNGKVYFNDKLVKEYSGYNNIGVYVSDKLIFIYWPGEQCYTTFIGAINEKGEFIEVETSSNNPVYGIYEKDGVVMGKAYICTTDPDVNLKYNAKFVYDGKKITLTKIN